MIILNYIIWNANPIIFDLYVQPRWYGLLFALGFILSQQILLALLKKEAPKDEKSQKGAEKDVEKLTIYLVVATIIGARLGHVLFYEPDKYLSNPLDILKIWEGGLASHGATIAILFALWLFARKSSHWTFLSIVDRIVIVVALTGALIRLGNFMNSEIYGLPTGSNYGVVFARNATEALTGRNSPVNEIEYIKGEKTSNDEFVPVTMNLVIDGSFDENSIKSWIENNIRNILGGRYPYISEHLTLKNNQTVDYTIEKGGDGNYVASVYLLGIPRHPTQLYESITTFLTFVLLLYLWYRLEPNIPEGRFLGLFLVINFGLRIIHELFKENQVDFEDQMALNMGQWLSIPLVLIGFYLIYRSYTKKVLEKSNVSQGTGS